VSTVSKELTAEYLISPIDEMFFFAAKPKIISDNFTVKEVYEEEEIVFEVRASGQPKPEAQWCV
jgi:hypothetical protein